jgi:hypothetical protein
MIRPKAHTAFFAPIIRRSPRTTRKSLRCICELSRQCVLRSFRFGQSKDDIFFSWHFTPSNKFRYPHNDQMLLLSGVLVKHNKSTQLSQSHQSIPSPGPGCTTKTLAAAKSRPDRRFNTKLTVSVGRPEVEGRVLQRGKRVMSCRGYA